MIDVFATFTFEAAHFLPLVPDGHKCGRMHGHNWSVEIHVTGEPGELGWVIDFYDIERAWREAVYDVVDHRVLNDIIRNPTTENIVLWIYLRLKPALPQLSRVTVRETPSFGATYAG